MDGSALSGKVALVTGSSRGIGRAIAEELARCGAAVVVNSHASMAEGEAVAEGIAASGGTALYLSADVGDYAAVCDLVARAVDALGGLDIVVNNADWFKVEPFEDNTPEYWDRIIRVGMLSAVHVTHAALPHLKRSDEGRVLTIAGDSGRVGLAQGAVHAGAMAALIALTKSWAREFAEFGVRVNAVSPGPIQTELWRDIQDSDSGPELLRTQFESLLGVGQPEDVAYAIAFLASPRARHITGQTLSVNGGRAFPS